MFLYTTYVGTVTSMDDVCLVCIMIHATPFDFTVSYETILCTTLVIIFVEKLNYSRAY